jgi:hypothetical protein
MEKLVYIKSWKTNEYSRLICIHKTYKQELENLFKNKYKVKVKDFDDDASVTLIYNDYEMDKREFWYKVFNLLIENGYKFVGAALSRYEWFKREYIKLEEERQSEIERQKKHQEEQERLKKEREEQRKKEEGEYGWLCGKYDCLTTLEFCKKCKYNVKYNLNCSPRKVKLIK